MSYDMKTSWILGLVISVLSPIAWTEERSLTPHDVENVAEALSAWHVENYGSSTRLFTAMPFVSFASSWDLEHNEDDFLHFISR